MNTVTLTHEDTATLLLLNCAILDVIADNITQDVIDELKALQPNLEHILFRN